MPRVWVTVLRYYIFDFCVQELTSIAELSLTDQMSDTVDVLNFMMVLEISCKGNFMRTHVIVNLIKFKTAICWGV